MQDLIYVVLIIALTVIAALFVLACDKVVGPDASALAERAREDFSQRAPVSAAREEAKVA